MNDFKHLTGETCAAYGERKLLPADILRVQSHLESCSDCRLRAAQTIGATAGVAALRTEINNNWLSDEEFEHLPFEHLQMFVDDQLDEVDREIAESHLAVCAVCTEDLADLRKFQVVAQTSAAAENVIQPAAATAPVAANPARARASVWQRIFGGAGLSNGLAATLAAVTFAALLGVVWLATRPAADTGEIAKTEPTPQVAFSPQNRVEPNASPAFTPQTQIQPDAQNANQVNNPNNSRNGLNAQPSPKIGLQSDSNSQPREIAPVQPAEIALNDGSREIKIGVDGRIKGLENLSPAAQNRIRAALETGRVGKSNQISQISGNSGVLMSGGAASNGVPFALKIPIGKVVRETQPTLRWQAFPGATAYTVAVVDENFNVFAASSRLAATEYKLEKPLPRGKNYSWQVTAINQDGSETVSPQAPAPLAKFRVLEQTAADEIAALENSGNTSHLQLGTLYANYGLTEEARRELEKLRALNPKSTLARKLLNSVRAK